MADDALATLFLELEASTERLRADVRKGLAGVEKQLNTSSGRFEKRMSAAFATIGPAIAAAFSVQKVKQFFDASLDEAKRFNRGMISVAKTTDLAGAELFRFEKGIEALERKTGRVASELLSTATAAGQLGIRGSRDLLKFTETMERLDSSTDGILAGDDAARRIARLLNLTGDGVQNVDRFGSAIAALGDNSKTTEAELLEVASRVAQGTAIYDVAAAKVLGLSAALVENDVAAERAGTAIQKAFTKMNVAVLEGGDNLQRFADLAGKTPEEFARIFRQDSFGAFVLFLEGLNRELDTAPLRLAELGLSGDRALSVFLPLANSVDNLRQHVAFSSAEWARNKKLVEESDKVYESAGGQIERLDRSFDQLQRNLGQLVLPRLREVAATLNDILEVGNEDPAAGWALAWLEAIHQVENWILGLFKTITVGILKVSATIKAALVAAFRVVAENAEAFLLGAFNNVADGLDDLINHMARGINFLKNYSPAGRLIPDLPTDNSFARDFLGPRQVKQPVKFGAAFAQAFQGSSANQLADLIWNLQGFTAGGVAEKAREFLDRMQGLRERFTGGGGGGSSSGGSRSDPDSVITGDALFPDEKDVANTKEAAKAVRGLGDAFAETAEELPTVTARLSEMAENIQRGAAFFADHFAHAFRSFADVTRSAGEAFRQMAADILADLAAMIIRQQVFNALMGAGSGGGTTGAFLSAVGSLLGGGRADGGRIQPGRIHPVGERGPELFVSDTAGMIIPNHDLAATSARGSAGAGATHVTVHHHYEAGVTRQQLAAEAARIERNTIAAIPGKVSRGGRYRRGIQR